jgi:site-specific DNA recombinase
LIDAIFEDRTGGLLFMGDWASLARVSTGEQFEEGESYENQIALNFTMIQKHGGSLFKEYTEEGVSAFKKRVQQRPVMLDLLNDILAGKVKNIVAFKRDRICRDPEDYYFLRNAFSKAGIKVYLTCGTETWGDPLTNSPTDELMDGLLPLLAKFESMTTAQRVRSAVQEAVKRGEWRNGRPPYGYTYDKTTKRIIQVPHQVETVRLIRDLYVQGNGAGRIADMLNNRYKIPYESPAVWKNDFKQKRDYWYEGVVTAVVAKPVYMGIQVWGGEYYECPAIDPIFNKAEWEAANAVYLNKLNKCVPHKYYNSVFLFKGVLMCAYCGEPMIPTYKTTKYTKDDGELSTYEYYHYKCSGRWDKHNGCKCKKHNRESVESALISMISEKIHDFDVDLLYKQLLCQIKVELKDYSNSVNQLEGSIKVLQKTVNQYLEAFVEAPSNSAIRKRLESKVEEVQKELEDRQAELAELIANPPRQDVEQNQIAATYDGMKKWEGIMNNPAISREVKRKLALDIVKKIQLDNEGNIDIEFKITAEFPRAV